MDGFQIPDKLYFKIGEVSQLVGVKPYVLRYWETEFKEITPVKSRTNQRLYKRRDVELLMKIAHLLYRERFTINGAKKRLKTDPKEKKGALEVQASNNQLGLDLPVKEDKKDFSYTDRLAIINELEALKKEMALTIK